MARGWGRFLRRIARALAELATVGGAADPGANYVNFDDLIPGSGGGLAVNNFTSANPGFITMTSTPDAQVAIEGSSGLYAPPFLTGGNGVYFGAPNQVPDGPDETPYLTAGGIPGNSGSSVTLTFSSGPQVYFGMLWGSVDTYNTLSFFSGAGLVAQLTGSQVIAVANGFQGSTGTVYLNLYSDVAFDSVVATSSQHAFEFDNVAYGTAPELGSFGIWGAVTALVAVLVRKNRRS